MKVGILGGSFNPIHIGHLALANYLCEYEDLDEIWFLVSPHNPLKERDGLWPEELRLQMVKQAIQGYPKFRASDFEFHLPRPSYMVNTLCHLCQSYPEHKFSLIIGSDNWDAFPRWHKYDEILSEYPIIIYPRLGYVVDETSLPESVRLVKTPVFDISSTFIRKAIDEGKDVRYFLPHGIWDYVKKSIFKS